MSTYMETKSAIEQLQQQMLALQEKLERERLIELEAEVVDIKKRIVAFGIEPAMLFSMEDLRIAVGVTTRKKGPPAGRPARPMKYEHAGHRWSGVGEKPRWFTAAIKAGITEQQMLINKGEPNGATPATS